MKGYDAVQLAVALYVNELLKANDLSLIFVSGDETLLQAARAEGMAPENPFDHNKLDAMRRKMLTEQTLKWIRSDPSIMMGKPVIVGTRITVELILEKLAAGETVAQILSAHPRLTEEAIRAALAFAMEVG